MRADRGDNPTSNYELAAASLMEDVTLRDKVLLPQFNVYGEDCCYFFTSKSTQSSILELLPFSV